MNRVRRRVLKVDAFRLALFAGLLFTLLHFLNVVFERPEWELPVISRIEHAAQDWTLTRLRGARPPSGGVVIVAIDEKSVEEEGIWPWSRAKMARLIDGLAAGGVKAVGFDVIWADEDVQGRRFADVAAKVREAREAVKEPAAAAALDAIWTTAQGAAGDPKVDVDPTEQLADAIERAHNVTVGFMLLSEKEMGAAADPARLAALQFFRTDPVHVARGGKLVALPEAQQRGVGRGYKGVVTPLEEILAVADSGGFFTVRPDPDGTIRRYPVVGRVGPVTFPALGIATLARGLGRDGVPAPVVPVGAEGGGETVLQVHVGETSIDTDDSGRVPISYYGPYRDFPSWSATDVLHGRIPRARMEGKIAVVGTTAPGTWDQRVTPFDDIAPGVITHATFMENVLRGELLERSQAVVVAELAAMLLLSVLLARLFASVGPLAAAPVLVAAMAAWIGAAVMGLRRFDLVIAIGMPLVQMMAMFLAGTTYRFFSEEREKRRARETFSRFLSPAMVEQVLAKEGALKLGGDKRELTVLFSDIRGFTTLSEKLDPHVLLEFLNEYLTPMTDIIVSGNRGTLDKYIGDAIMAFWGAPQSQPDHALLACKAALEMMARLQELKVRWHEQSLPEIDIGVGINTGPMSVGFVGSQDRFYNYTVLGDAVNLASRLEGANKEYGTHVIIGPTTYEQVEGRVVTRELDQVRVKGKREPVKIHELISLAPATPEASAFVEAFTWGLGAYKAQRWDEAVARFKEADRLRGDKGDPCSRKYIARCEAMRRDPPGPEWDGVFEMKTK
jgi:adenylate cyclase